MATRRVIPGFGLSMGYTLSYLSLIVLIPLSALVWKTAHLHWDVFWSTVTNPIVMAAYKLSFGASLLAAAINGVLGLMTAWVLVRYRFPGRRLLDAVIDFPFALPTAVTGLTFSDLYSPHGWMGALGDHTADAANFLLGALHVAYRFGPGSFAALNLQLANTNTGVVVVLIFVGLPFVVRLVQPVLENMDVELEQAARSLGAGPFTTFRRVIFPELLPAWLSGLSLAFARSVGEYGSVIFIAGNIPGKSQIAPQKIIDFLYGFEAGGTAKATAIGVVLLSASLVVLVLINALQWWARRHER
ncbi:MAG: sulfate transporter permease subunit CysT [Phycisphaerales bacterium]|nr:sulfate transporter permease subunit CysT [Phycisphaerales bacterium]